MFSKVFRNMLPKVSEGADREEKREWLSDLVRITILIWSAGLLTASYVRLPGGQKVMDFDPTFIASVFSGSLAGFGVAVASKTGALNGNGGASAPAEAPVLAAAPRRQEEEEKTEPEVTPIWDDTPVETPAASLEERVEALETKVEADAPESTSDDSGEGFVRPRRGDL
jgi:hypothetical protein